MDANLRTEKSGVRRLAKRDVGRLKGDFCVAGGNAPPAAEIQAYSLLRSLTYPSIQSCLIVPPLLGVLSVKTKAKRLAAYSWLMEITRTTSSRLVIPR